MDAALDTIYVFSFFMVIRFAAVSFGYSVFFPFVGLSRHFCALRKQINKKKKKTS